MDDRQELRDALDLVEDDGVAARLPAHEVTQPLGPGHQLPLDLRPQEIDVESVGQDVSEPRRLPGTARAEEEKALVRRLEEAIRYFRFWSQNGMLPESQRVLRVFSTFLRLPYN